ncbi:MAG: hypothetical protein IKB55_05380 [Clostridia bacterium]|nr:hypothetical protein [Clostridia bacterium]
MKNGNKMTVNYKEKELRERIMKYYVYLSKSKINMLYEQIDNCVEIEHTKKGKITTGVFAGDVSSTEKKATTLSQRLDKIIENANDFGDISFDNEYATNKLSMTWTHINSDDITYWTGIIDDESITTKLLLIGSAHNIIGNNEEKCKGYSYSLTRAFVGKLNQMKGDIKEDSNRESNVSKEQNDSSDYVDFIERLCRRNQKEDVYEFVAKLLYTDMRMQPDGKLCRYVIATPLYVSLVSPVENHIIFHENKKKYILSKEEFDKHRRYNFKSLHLLLRSANMNAEERKFNSEMNKIAVQTGVDKFLGNLTKRKDFLNKAHEIIDRYFYIE